MSELDVSGTVIIFALLHNRSICNNTDLLHFRPASYYTIRLGDHNRKVNEVSEQDIQAKQVIVHPDYNKIPIDSDIALIQLSRPATLTSKVKTVCLPSYNEVVPAGSKCYITGKEKIMPLNRVCLFVCIINYK